MAKIPKSLGEAVEDAIKGAKTRTAVRAESKAFSNVLPTIELKPSRIAKPQQKALRLAQVNASKPVSEGGLGLRPDNTAEERALAMGFNDDVYHSTPSGFNGSSVKFPEGENRVSHKLEGLYGSTMPSMSEWYAQNKDGLYGNGAVMMPLKYRMNNPVNMIGNREITQKERNALLDVLLPMGNERWANEKANLAKTESDMVRIMGNAGVSGDIQRKMLLNLGYDSAKDGHEMIAIDPRNVRSRFAVFDPMRKDSSDLMAGMTLPVFAIPQDADEQKNSEFSEMIRKAIDGYRNQKAKK